MFSPDGYRALRSAAAVIRRGDRGLLEVLGVDRLSWLQGLLTNDVASLPIGWVCDAAYLTPQGRMITDMRVFNLRDRALLDVPASLAEALQKKLDSLLFSEDAQILDVSSRETLVDVHGPKAHVVLKAATSPAEPGKTNPAELQDSIRATLDDAAYGEPGISLVIAHGDVDAVIAHLVAHGAVETTLATLDVVRVEAGRPAFLLDMDEHTIPLEAGIEHRAISFTKGCYVGQEVIIRVMHRGGGRVAKKLVGLTVTNGILPVPGDIIATGDREIGRITSAVWSPALEKPIGLGYVHRDFVEPGTSVELRSASATIDATVTSLPFVEVGSRG